MLPLKINTDLDPTNAPENSSTLNVNMNADILKGVISNEQGFDIITLTNDNRKIIGACLLPDNSTCLFSQIFNNANYASEIGVVKEGVYTVILRDNLAANAELGFNTANLIQAQSKVNFNGDFVIYWVDGNNSDKWLNITNLQVDTTTDLKITDAAQFNLMLGFLPAIGDLPELSITNGGNLASGMYYVALTYGDKFQNFTKTSLISNPIPVAGNDVGLIADTPTNKAINVTLFLGDINIEYNFVKVTVISKINQVLKAYEFGTFQLDFSTSSYQDICIIDTLVNKTEVSVDSVIINNAGYNSSLTITQLDDVLYKAHLRNRETIDLQPYVNNIKINYVQKEINLSTDSYVNPAMTFYSKGFMYDEVYALYASFIIDDNGEYETQAYHIPGREVAPIDLGDVVNPLENKEIGDLNSNEYGPKYGFTFNNSFIEMINVNSNATLFHTVQTNDNPLASTNMGYWENKDELYSNEDKWLTLAADGSLIADNLKGTNVRHHKFPEAYNYTSDTITPNLTKSIHPSATNYNIVNILGIRVSDVVIPDELAGKVKKINIYYAKRDLNNRTILGQSLLQSLSQFHTPDATSQGTLNGVFNNGGQFVAWQMNNTGSNPWRSGLFPVGYQRTTAQNYVIPPFTLYSKSGSWMYSDEFGRSPDYWTKGYYKLKAFDLMQQSVDISSGTYIKNLYRVKSRHVKKLLGGDPTNRDSNIYVGYLFDPTNTRGLPVNNTTEYSNFYGIDKLVNNDTALFNHIREVTNSSYVTKNFPNQRLLTAGSPYPFAGVPFNYGGQTGIWLETDYYLYSWNLNAAFNGQGNDFSYVNYWADVNFPNGVFDSEQDVYTSPYISNLCVFRLNIFQSFDNQTLCLAGSFDVGDGFFDAYGGDTFTTVNSDIDGIDLAGYSPQGNTLKPINERPQNQLKSIHCYITQSTSNPNYRYEGDNSWETFYPYSTADQMFGIPQSDPEWYGYNIDYSAVNDLKQPVIASNFDNQLQDYFPNRVIRSAKDNPEIQQDNYLDYQAGDYKDFGKIKGKIRNITNQNNKLLIKTDNALYATLGREVISTENAEANVTSGDIFAVKPRELVSSDSYGGGLGRFADVVTQYGYMYPDTTNGIVYNFNGQAVDEISKAGRQIFFRNELKFKLPKQIDTYVFNNFPAYSSVTSYVQNYYVTYNGKVWISLNTVESVLGTPGQSDDWQIVDYNFNRIDSIVDPYSIGVQAIFDYKYRRYILTKKDYTFNTVAGIFGYVGNIPENAIEGVTNGLTKAWYNGYIYTLYINELTPAPPANAEYLVTRGLTEVYGVKTDFNSIGDFILDSFVTAYYPELQAWVSMYDFGGVPEFKTYTIDKVYSFNGNTLFKHNSDTQNALFYDRETPYTSFVEPILNTPQGVKRFSSFSFITELFRNNGTLDYLKTFTNYFVRNSYQISDKIEVVNANTARNAEGYFNANEFRDLTRDNSKPLMTDAIIHQPDTANINVNKHWSKQKKFVDYYLIPRLEYTPEVLTGTNLIINSVNYTLDGILEEGTIIKFSYLGVTYVYQLNQVQPFGGNTTVVTIGYVVSLNNTPVLNSTITIPTFEYTFKRTLDLFDINTLTHKNTR